jgi:hypothetical protein
MLAVHLVARLRRDRIDLRRPETAPVLWDAIRSRFPDILIEKVMPDHLHSLVPPCDPEEARAKLANACGRVQYSLGWPEGSWERVPPPRIITKRSEARRHFRYIALNECRSGHARDPLEPLWSTYREIFGAVVDPWSDRAAVLRFLDAPRRNPLAWLHGFVSGDPTVAVDGTPMPRPVEFGRIPSMPLTDVIRAATAALRLPADAIRRRGSARRLFVGLASAVGWRIPAALAEACDVTERAIRRLTTQVDPRAVATAAVCLGDPRLLARTPLITTAFSTAR